MERMSSVGWVWLSLYSVFAWIICFDHMPTFFKESDGNICINEIESKGTDIANILIMNLAM